MLHLWPFTIQDLRGLGAKKFYGKFCAGAIDHISEYIQLFFVFLEICIKYEHIISVCDFGIPDTVLPAVNIV